MSRHAVPRAVPLTLAALAAGALLIVVKDAAARLRKARQ